MKEKENGTGITGREVLRISLNLWQILVDETKRVFPVEACALLFGQFTEKEIVVKKIVTVPNILNSDVEFEIDGETLGRVIDQNGNLKLIGFFHSHPYLSFPSDKDIEFMRLWPDTIWLIYSTIQDEGLSAFRIKNGRLERVTLHIYKEP